MADLIGQVREDGVRYAKAEIAFHRERLTLRVGEFKQVAIFGVAAALIALSALITLLVGLVMTLTPRVGPFWATLIVVGASLLLAFLLVKVAQRHLGRIGGAA
nr:phage holin family protein [Sphingomonas jejuensis]